MRTVTFCMLLIAFLSANILSAQTQVWHQSDTTIIGGNFTRIALDGSGNIFAGTLGTNAAIVLKYDTSGVQKWQASFHATSSITLSDMVADAAGNSYFCGNYFNSTGYDAFIAKVNPLGTIQWSPTLDYQQKYDSYAAITLDQNGNIIAVGTSVDSASKQQLIVTKYSSAGTITWSRHYGAANFSYNGEKVTTDASGNIYVACDRTGLSSGFDFDALKFDSAGVFQWEQAINSAADYNDFPNAISVDNGGNVYLAGYADSAQGLARFGFITKVDAAGNASWSKMLRFSNITEVHACAMDGNGNLYVGGWDDHPFIAKINVASGDTLWRLEYAGQQTTGGIEALQFKNGNLYATGYIQDSVAQEDLFTVKASIDGHLLWSDSYNGQANIQDYGSSIVVGNDGNFYVGGGSGETTNGQVSPAIIRYHETPTGIFQLQTNSPFTVAAYPNPTDKLLQFVIDLETPGHVAMYIYDMSGKQVATVIDQQMEIGKNTVQWDAEGLTKGTYLYEMVTPTGKSVGKFIKY